MTIKSGVIGCTLIAGALVALAAGGIYVANHELNEATRTVGQMIPAIRNHLEADMMHDARRSDVLAASAARSGEDRAAAIQSLREHASTRASLEANMGLNLAEEIRTQLPAVADAITRYEAAAELACTSEAAEPERGHG